MQEGFWDGSMSKLPPVKRVALFLRTKAVIQRKHESANVSFCDPVLHTGFQSKQKLLNNEENIFYLKG